MEGGQPTPGRMVSPLGQEGAQWAVESSPDGQIRFGLGRFTGEGEGDFVCGLEVGFVREFEV